MQLPEANRSTLRKRALAKRICKLRAEGYTTRQIAELCGVSPARIKALAELGQRLLSLEEPQ